MVTSKRDIRAKKCPFDFFISKQGNDYFKMGLSLGDGLDSSQNGKGLLQNRGAIRAINSHA